MIKNEKKEDVKSKIDDHSCDEMDKRRFEIYCSSYYKSWMLHTLTFSPYQFKISYCPFCGEELLYGEKGLCPRCLKGIANETSILCDNCKESES